MSFAEICKTLEKYLWYFAIVLLLPLGVAILYDFFLEEPYFSTSSTRAFLQTIAVCLILTTLSAFFGRKATGRSLLRKEGIVFVVLIWIFTTLIAALPFQFTRVIQNPLDAVFEAMSGLTTTGVSIVYPKAYDSATGKEIPITISNPLDSNISYTFYGNVAPIKDKRTGKILYTGVEALGKPLLFWRSFLQWLGGIGIMVLFISVLPALGLGGKFLYESEMPGFSREGMVPHVRKIAEALWKIYVGITIAQIFLHIATDPAMSFFDSVTLSFSTISTGGFSVHNEGLLAYHNPSVGWIMGFFMFLAGISFSLYYHCLKKRFSYIKDPEFYCYVIFLFAACVIMSWDLFADATGFLFKEIFGFAPFQAISAMTTCGFSITNYDMWPLSSQLFMLILTFVGGMSGSAVGGFKIIRMIVIFRVIFYKIRSFFRPGVTRMIQVGNNEVPYKTQMSVFAFFCIILALAVLGTYMLILDRIDAMTSLSVISASITNSGLLFGGIGSQASLTFLPTFSKIISILWMLLGRLECFSLLVLLLPSFWRNR